MIDRIGWEAAFPPCGQQFASPDVRIAARSNRKRKSGFGFSNGNVAIVVTSCNIRGSGNPS